MGVDGRGPRLAVQLGGTHGDGLLAGPDAALLARAWRLASRIRSANVIWNGKASDLLPSSRRDLEAVARWCGYEPGNATALEEDYLRVSRRARAVFERVFYGQ